MATLITYSNLERQPWTVYNDASVNPTAMDDVQIGQGEVLTVYMRGSKPWAGALVAWKESIPTLPGMNLAYSALDFEVWIDSDTLSLLAALEADLKNCWQAAPPPTTIANIMDGSCQLTLSEGGMWQIDSAAGVWADTGIKGTLAPNAWNKISTRQKMNGDGTFSFLSINGAPIPASMQNLPLLKSNWSTVLCVQMQMDINAPGFVVASYRNITVTLSDEAI